MFERWLINMVIAFILRQLAKFGRDVDWEKVAADAEVRVRALVPGDWFDDEAVAIVHGAIAVVKKALAAEEDWARVLKHLAASEWNAALEALKELIGKIWTPAAAAEQRVAAALCAVG